MPRHTEYAMATCGGAGLHGAKAGWAPALMFDALAVSRAAFRERRALLAPVSAAWKWPDVVPGQQNSAARSTSEFPGRRRSRVRGRWLFTGRLFLRAADRDETTDGRAQLHTSSSRGRPACCGCKRYLLRASRTGEGSRSAGKCGLLRSRRSRLARNLPTAAQCM